MAFFFNEFTTGFLVDSLCEMTGIELTREQMDYLVRRLDSDEELGRLVLALRPKTPPRLDPKVIELIAKREHTSAENVAAYQDWRYSREAAYLAGNRSNLEDHERIAVLAKLGGCGVTPENAEPLLRWLGSHQLEARWHAIAGGGFDLLCVLLNPAPRRQRNEAGHLRRLHRDQIAWKVIGCVVGLPAFLWLLFYTISSQPPGRFDLGLHSAEEWSIGLPLFLGFAGATALVAAIWRWMKRET